MQPWIWDVVVAIFDHFPEATYGEAVFVLLGAVDLQRTFAGQVLYNPFMKEKRRGPF